MKINGYGDLPGAKKIGQKPLREQQKPSVAGEPKASSGEDVVELSPQAKMASSIRTLPDVRQQKIDKIKGQIERGEYLTPEKLDKALDRMLEELL